MRPVRTSEPTLVPLSPFSLCPRQQPTLELGTDINVPASFAFKYKAFGGPQLTGGITGTEGVSHSSS